MQALLCIDDTDNLDSIGTGEMLQNLSQLLDQKNLAQAGFVTRHQLFLHEDIAYTSHNSAMCTGLLLRQEDLAEILSVAGRFLQEEAAEGSDPGLCLLCYEALTDRAELIAFGRRAKQEVLQKQDAYQLAAKYPGIVFLSEHGEMCIRDRLSPSWLHRHLFGSGTNCRRFFGPGRHLARGRCQDHRPSASRRRNPGAAHRRPQQCCSTHCSPAANGRSPCQLSAGRKTALDRYLSKRKSTGLHDWRWHQ